MKTSSSSAKSLVGSARVSVAILAGGQSSRMGQDKAQLQLNGRSFLAQIRATARALGLPVRVIRHDRIKQCGPLGGIYTALISSRADAELFLACDMPFVSPTLLRRVLRGLRAKDAACFVTKGKTSGFPFVARATCAQQVKQQLLRGQFSLQQLARTLQARRLRLPPRSETDLFNINTREDLATARQRSEKSGPTPASARRRTLKKRPATGPVRKTRRSKTSRL